eukprot:CAMPEP_0117647876 /NCGR_PEP_ID=MMETSP0804-20121206/82_1 /TAXON_ID=1074897 /ORGANISM="Tetraselmis astigmatica, Strain CCMP880" /LENGTH=190 /DNA_ID=CAMNT_0005453395 /DNA_START=1706 /DNA_END=2277 /DNA_ORIENTATION=+
MSALGAGGCHMLSGVRVAGVFLLLWFCVGLFFAALMAIGLEIRGNQYLMMEQRFFGRFERPLIPLTVFNPETTRTTVVGSFNRPNGCAGDFMNGYVCDPLYLQSSNANNAWFLGSWINSPAWLSTYPACSKVNTTGDMANATMIAPSADNLAGDFAGYCLNVLPIGSFIPAVPFQNYPTFGLTEAPTVSS